MFSVIDWLMFYLYQLFFNSLLLTQIFRNNIIPSMVFSSNLINMMTNFILMEYDGMGSQKGLTLVGVDAGGNLVTAFKNNSSSEQYTSTSNVTVPRDKKVLNIISWHVTKEKQPAHRIVTLKEQNGKFSNEIFSNQQSLKVLKQSETTPLFVTDPETPRPLLGFSENGKLKFYSLDASDNLQEAKQYEMNATLPSNHTSSFIDLSGDLKPNLALTEVINNKKYLGIYHFHKESRNLIGNKIPLPDNIGPTLFADTNGDNSFDLLYVSIENNISYLNIHMNKVVPEFLNANKMEDPRKYLDTLPDQPIYQDSPNYKINIGKYAGGHAVISNEDNMPTGLFLADLDMSGQKQIFITMNNNGVKKARCFLFQDGQLSISPIDKIMAEYSNIVSVSTADIGDRGVEGLVINYIVDGKPTLIYKKIKTPQENTKITAITNIRIDPTNQWHLPGATYLILYKTGKKCKKAAQFSCSSYPSLQHQGVYVGLGSTNLFLKYIIVRTNFSHKVYDMFKSPLNIIVPNSSIILYVNSANWSVQSFFGLERYTMVVVCLSVLLFFNLVILVILTIREKSAQKKVESDEKVMMPIFNAL